MSCGMPKSKFNRGAKYDIEACIGEFKRSSIPAHAVRSKRFRYSAGLRMAAIRCVRVCVCASMS